MHYDLTIVGGGLVGAGLAVALRDAGIKMALLDASLPQNNDPRLFALNYSSCQFLKNLNLWDALSPFAAPIHQVHVSHQGQFGAVRLSRSDVHLSELGHVVPAYHIETALNQTLTSLNNLTLYRPVKLKKLIQSDHHCTLTISDLEKESTFTSQIVIGADGAASTVREELNIPCKQFDYQQSAIVTKTTIQRPHQHIAYERFYKQGAIAMLPLSEQEYATIWTADNACITSLMALSDEDFLIQLQKEFGYRLGRLEKIATRHPFPLKMVVAEKSLDRSVLLLGNAAHALHPIAAQGFNLALFEVARLAESILKKTSSQAPFSAHDLQQVHDEIQSQQKMGIQLSHRLARLFSSSALKKVLPFGMVGLDVCPVLKNKLINKMLGRGGKTPGLLLV